MEFRLLGQLEVLQSGEPMALRGRKLRTLLAVLLLNANRPVSVERLVDALWEDRPPDSARPTLQYFVHRLRKSLAGASGREDLLVTQAGGYLLRIKPTDLDTERFRRELARAREARDQGDLAAAAVGYERALALWRGPALADFAEESFAQGDIARLEEMRLTAIEEDADVRLGLGRHAELVGELEGLVRAHTLRERLLGQLILALYRSGRQVEALGTYRAARRRLVSELGIEPSADLQRLERAILAQDPKLELPLAAADFFNRSVSVAGQSPAGPPASPRPSSEAPTPGQTRSGEPGPGQARPAADDTRPGAGQSTPGPTATKPSTGAAAGSARSAGSRKPRAGQPGTRRSTAGQSGASGTSGTSAQPGAKRAATGASAGRAARDATGNRGIAGRGERRPPGLGDVAEPIPGAAVRRAAWGPPGAGDGSAHGSAPGSTPGSADGEPSARATVGRGDDTGDLLAGQFGGGQGGEPDSRAGGLRGARKAGVTEDGQDGTPAAARAGGEAGEQAAALAGAEVSAGTVGDGGGGARGARDLGEAAGERDPGRGAGTGAGAGGEPARRRRRQASSARPRRAERKLITVLVAGVVETAPDPEDLRAKHAEALQRIRHEVERFGGVVYAAIGGTVLSAFGIPRTREDDPERAVRAALRIASGHNVRVGVDTGEAVVAPPAGGVGALGLPSGIGTASTLVAGIAGTVVDTASTLLALTPPGAVLVGPATYRSTQRAIEYPPNPTAGDTAWQPIAPRSRIGAVVYEPSGEERSPLIERDGDLGLLQSLLRHVRAELGPQLVTVVGAAGIGKTRLVHELGQLVEADADLITWRQGRSVPADDLGERAAFWAFAEIVRAHAGIKGSDDDAAKQERLHRAVVDAIGDPEEAASVERSLRPLVGLDGTEPAADDHQRETFAAWARFIEAVAADRPLALVFEDLQWADDAMLEFVEDVVDLVGPVPLLVVATARPELLERRRDWGGGKRNAVIVSLTPLSAQGSAQLLDTRLSRAGLSDLGPRTRKLLLARSGGNPLFLEEYVRMLQDEPRRMTAAPLPIPQTIHQLITSRLDALEPEDKALLEDLAVLGEANWAEPLVAISGMDRDLVVEGLRRLERRELLRRTRATSAGGEHGYAFRHALIRDVAYRQLLRADRADRHHRAAEWLERHGDTISERVDLLARHYEHVLDLTPEAPGELVDVARLSFRAAGDRASALGALATAAHWYRRALALWPAGSPDRPDLLLRLGGALVFSAHTGEEVLAEARQAFESSGEVAKVRTADRYLAQLHWFHGRADLARRHGERAAVGRRGDGGGTGDARDQTRDPTRDQARDLPWLPALGALLSCDYDEAITAATEVAERGRAAGSPEMVGVGLALAGTARLFTGDPDGVDQAERGIRALEKAGSPGVAFFRVGLAEALWWWGDLERCEEVLAAVLESAAEESPEALWAGSTRTMLDYAAGRWDDVLEFVEAALSGTFSGTLGYQESTCRMVRARIRFGHGDLDGALSDARAAVELATTAGNRRNRAVALALTGRIMLTSNHLSEAVVCLEQLLDEARQQRHATLPCGDLASLLVDLGRTGDLPDNLPPTRWREAATAFVALDFLRAAEVYAEIGSLPDEAVTRLRAAVQLAAAGRPAEALVEARRMAEFSHKSGVIVGAAAADAIIAGITATLGSEAAGSGNGAAAEPAAETA